jgi:hypothetical protein
MGGHQRATTSIDAAVRSAGRFYWVWLGFATSVSVLGNIAHAVLVAPAALWVLAAIASIVPPVFVLGSTHSAALRLKMRRYGLLYAVGLLMTIGVAACAFLLSFDALRDLAVMLGWPAGKAWLFPIAIDVSITQATFGLLSVSPAEAASQAEMSTPSQPRPPAEPPPNAPSGVINANGQRAGTVRSPTATTLAPPPAAPALDTPTPVLAAVADSPARPHDHPGPARYQPSTAELATAHELVRNGTTSKDPHTVAAVLAEHAAGTPPSTISRRRGIHHSTVGRILAGARDLTD